MQPSLCSGRTNHVIDIDTGPAQGHNRGSGPLKWKGCSMKRRFLLPVCLVSTMLALGLIFACGGGGGSSNGGGGGGSNSPEEVGRAVVQAYIDGDTGALRSLLRPDTGDYLYSVSEMDLSECVISQALAEQEDMSSFRVTVTFKTPCTTPCPGCDPSNIAVLGVDNLSGHMYWQGNLATH